MQNITRLKLTRFDDHIVSLTVNMIVFFFFFLLFTVIVVII